MGMAIGAFMGILMMIGLAKSAYDRYFRNRAKPKIAQKPLTTEVENPLTHSNWEIRMDAIQQLEPLAANIEMLIPMLDDEDYEVRIAARDALAAIGEPAIDALVDVLQNGKPETRPVAAIALGMIGDKTTVRHLVEALSHDNKWVRLGVVEALGHFNTQTARKALANIRDNDEDSQVSEAAQKALTS